MLLYLVHLHLPTLTLTNYTHSLLSLSLSLSLSAIMAAANLLPVPPPVRHASSVKEWLQLLHLSSLEDKFTDYTLDKITTLWDIQLTTSKCYHSSIEPAGILSLCSC